MDVLAMDSIVTQNWIRLILSLVENLSEYLKQVLHYCNIWRESSLYFSGETYNGECINRLGVDGSSISIKRSTYHTYNSTHIEDCSKFCKQSRSSGDYTTWSPQTTGYPRPTRYPTTDRTGTDFWGTTYWYSVDPDHPRTFDKEKETEDLPEVKTNGQLEHQYFGWENYDRSKLHFSLMSFIRSNRNFWFSACWCGNTSPIDSVTGWKFWSMEYSKKD